jgi:hypothetical protein
MFSIIPEEILNHLRELFGHQIDALGKNELTILASCHIEGEYQIIGYNTYWIFTGQISPFFYKNYVRLII